MCADQQSPTAQIRQVKNKFATFAFENCSTFATMSAKYNFSVSTDFTESKVNPAQLRHEVKQSDIAATCTKINQDGDSLFVWFDAELGASDQSTLNNLIGSHVPLSYNITKGYVQSSLDLTETTGSTYLLKKQVRYQVVDAGQFLLQWSGEVGNTRANRTTLVRIVLDGVNVLCETGYESDNVHVSRRLWSGFQLLSLQPGEHTVDFQFKSVTDGGSALLDNLFVRLVREK